MVNGQIAFSDLVKQCTMYSCDMGIHFYKYIYSVSRFGKFALYTKLCLSYSIVFQLSPIPFVLHVKEH